MLLNVFVIFEGFLDMDLRDLRNFNYRTLKFVILKDWDLVN